MTPDLTPQIDAALDRMDQLLSDLKQQGKKPITAKMTRHLAETGIKSLEDSQDPDAPTVEERPVLKLPKLDRPVPPTRPMPRTVSRRRLAGG